jgi:hypothetical protein
MAPVLTNKFGKIIILSGVCFQPTELSGRRQPMLGKHLMLKDGFDGGISTSLAAPVVRRGLSCRIYYGNLGPGKSWSRC